MGWVSMSERELRRVEVLTSVVNGHLTATAAAGVLDLSRRQVHRLLAALRDGGAAALRHKNRGRRSNRALSDELKTRVLALVRETYTDFGPTLLAETLAERHGIGGNELLVEPCRCIDIDKMFEPLGRQGFNHNWPVS